MADLTITATNVIPGSDASLKLGRFGETVVAGKPVYLSTATKKWMLADSNAVATEARRATGIAVVGGALDQVAVVQSDGDLALGAILTAGTAYYLSDTPGGICPVADVGTGENVCLLGFAKTTSVLDVAIQYPGVTL